MDFETRAIHEGQEPDPATGALTTPIYETSTYVQEAVGKHKGYDYSRVANPTRTALQACLASLEDAEHGIAFSSGIGAVSTLMVGLSPSLLPWVLAFFAGSFLYIGASDLLPEAREHDSPLVAVATMGGLLAIYLITRLLHG